jgi:ABC-type branched-subunit amino acid transport system ATPase component
VVCGAVAPTAGRVHVRDRPTAGLRPNAVAALGVGRSFQMAEGFSAFTVDDYVSLGFSAADAGASWRRRRGARRERVEGLLADVGLADRIDARLGTLPYGVRKVVDLCRVVVGDPHLMLLDEPTSGLSREERAEMVGHVTRFADSGRRTIVVVDHDVGFVTEVSDRVLALAAGRVVAHGPPAEVMSAPAVVEAYLGTAS